MKIFKVHFIAKEPLIISDGTTEGMKHESMPYVPGSMLLGALVSIWKQKNTTDGNPIFEALFLQGEVKWGHAFPVCQERPCVPTPLAWEYVKDKGSLPVYDSLADVSELGIFNSLQTQDIHENTASQDADIQAWQNVLAQHSKRKRITQGFVDIQSLCAPQSAFTRSMHVALDSAKRKAEEGRLFGYEAIAQGTKLCSEIFCEDAFVEPVRALLAQVNTLFVGHSRSAGYGALCLDKIEELSANLPKDIAPQEHTLWLTGDYFPKQSWKKPLDALKAELEEYLGSITWDDKKCFCRDTRLEGFHGLWRLPRATRHGLCAGSVLSFTCQQGGALPAVLGAWQQEGYGRFLLNAPVLQEIRIKPTPINREESGYTRNENPQAWPFLTVWRNRSLVRLAEEQAMSCIWAHKVWDSFFESLRTSKVKQNQRGNMRNMISHMPATEWLRAFVAILEKTPGRQWSSAIVKSPFGGSRRYLSEVMMQLLDGSILNEKLEQGCKDVWFFPVVAGGKLSDEEKKNFAILRHKRFLLEFLKRWEKEARQAQEGDAK